VYARLYEAYQRAKQSAHVDLPALAAAFAGRPDAPRSRPKTA
jgi:hypothetical protein